MIEDRFMRRPEVEALTGLSRSSIYRLMSDGEFVPRYRLGKQAVGWKLSEVMAWLNDRVRSDGWRLWGLIAPFEPIPTPCCTRS
ncbi:MAG: hypothetical protein CMH34_01060 [Microbacterium sp.]|nr:hypothetical protein [Microbacterium sp.]